MISTDWRGTECRSGDDRSPEMQACLRMVQAVLDAYGFALSHEDDHGSFQLIQGQANDLTRDWLANANELIQGEPNAVDPE